jgi:hypothetical protein
MTFDPHPPDRQARAAHQAALRSLSPHARAQLQRRIRLALAGDRSGSDLRQPRWGWIAAPALALAGAFALPWPGGDAPGTTATARVASDAAPAAELAAPLEQDPDFYLWLASADAVALARDRP